MREKEAFNYSDYSNLIGLIYDAAQNPTLWPELLNEMGEHLTINPAYASLHNIEEALIPHFSRAIAINQRLLKLETKNNTSNQILNRLPIGVIVSNQDAEIIAINERALTVLNDGQTLSNQQGIIESNSRQQSAELQQLIRSYASDNPPNHGASLLIKASDASCDTSIWITASDESAKEMLEAGNIAIIYIASSLIQPEFDVQTIQHNFGLTVSEARLIKALVNGCHNLNDVAEKLDISIHTVRTQINHIFEKTDTNNQVELVKKVLTSPSAIFGKAQPPHKISSYTGSTQDTGLQFYLSIKLHDGRRLSYAEYGDPEGKPVFIAHPVFGSRLQYPANETTAQSLGLRMIVPDRPGHGCSDMQANRTLLDWPDDLCQLADHLELENFSILSVSGGCTYSLACAYKTPQRLHQVIIVSGRDPIDALTDTLSIDRLTLGMARHAPAIFAKFTKVLISDLAKDPHKALQRRYKNLSETDQAYIASDQANRNMYANALIESVRQGSEGVTQDIIINMQPWGFSLAEITGHIRLWHGLEDKAFPPHTGQQLADALANGEASSEITMVPDIGSLLILAKWDDILSDLTDRL